LYTINLRGFENLEGCCIYPAPPPPPPPAPAAELTVDDAIVTTELIAEAKSAGD